MQDQTKLLLHIIHQKRNIILEYYCPNYKSVVHRSDMCKNNFRYVVSKLEDCKKSVYSKDFDNSFTKFIDIDTDNTIKEFLESIVNCA
jgi:hypothetical protein